MGILRRSKLGKQEGGKTNSVPVMEESVAAHVDRYSDLMGRYVTGVVNAAPRVEISEVSGKVTHGGGNLDERGVKIATREIVGSREVDRYVRPDEYGNVVVTSVPVAIVGAHGGMITGNSIDDRTFEPKVEVVTNPALLR